jgi:hypothetical protein
MTRSRARHLLPHYTTRRRLAMDFYCQLSSDGIRAFYPTEKLLRTIPRKQRAMFRGRIMVALTAGHRYALHGIRPGTKLTKKAQHRLKVGRAYHVGKNFWYVTPNGASRGVLKVRRGVVQEVGIASKRFTGSVAARRRFLRLLL